MLTAVGTLAGSLPTGMLAHFTQRAQRVAAEVSARRAEVLEAVSALVPTLADHRRAMAVREQLRLDGEDWSAVRTESHTSRSAIGAPLLRGHLLEPALAATAQSAAQAVYVMREATTEAGLQEAREHAIRASDALVDAAGAALVP
ncbi:protein kilB [Streptomyces microflavus]|uniref:Protein kilB n=1 Tax=Streptomyces microflavus TaxID=1919 RepID=A0ABV1QD13_STRMI|nr:MULTISPECIES: protein kilB [unclassified Streptomyces]QTA36922.1 hypothetical protein JHY03_71380 [Streptomyces sp. CA-256286]